MRDATTNPRTPLVGETDPTPSGSATAQCQPWCDWPDTCADLRSTHLDRDTECISGAREVAVSALPPADWRTDGQVEAQALQIYAEQRPTESAARFHVGLNDTTGVTLTVSEATQLVLAVADRLAVATAPPAATPSSCGVSWCMGDPCCGGRDHQAETEEVTCTGDAHYRDDLRVCAATNSADGYDVVSMVSHDDRWMAELRPTEAIRLALVLLRQVALLEAEPGVGR